MKCFIELPILEFSNQGLMLVEHEAHQNFVALLAINDVRVIAFSSFKDITALKKVRDDVRLFNA